MPFQTGVKAECYTGTIKGPCWSVVHHSSRLIVLYVDDLAAGVSEAANPLSPMCGLQGKRFVWQVQLFSWRLGFSVVVRHVCEMDLSTFGVL